MLEELKIILRYSLIAFLSILAILYMLAMMTLAPNPWCIVAAGVLGFGIGICIPYIQIKFMNNK